MAKYIIIGDNQNRIFSSEKAAQIVKTYEVWMADMGGYTAGLREIVKAPSYEISEEEALKAVRKVYEDMKACGLNTPPVERFFAGTEIGA